MARRATYVKQARANGEILLLDAGDSLIGDEDPANATRGASSIDFMNRMGYDAMAVGSSDLLLGKTVLQERRSEAQFPFLSANVVLSTTGELWFEPYLVKEVGDVRVGILGITDVWEVSAQGVRVTDPFSATASFVPELRGKVDLVVVLSRAGRAVDQRIAAEVPGIDFIIGGGPYDQTYEIIENHETGTVTVQADRALRGHAGRYFGVFKITLDADKKRTDYAWQIKSMDPEIADDADITERVNYWRQQAFKKG
ncbi:MAG TPA: hypothetical protein DCM67_08660 [Propionibacteriaceae bacterium]|nr:hypothetical protein [Propionibacteriaceae bacterium]